MLESRLFRQTFFIIWALTALVRTTRDGAAATLSQVPQKAKEEKNEIYAQRIMNIHQPVYQAGYGNFQMVKPMFLTPPPPAIKENLILEASPIYNSKDVRIATKAKVMKYPMQFANQFNYYQFPRTYNPFFGKDSPVNNYHPFNMLYGPQQYTPINAYGQPNYADGKMPYLSHNLQKKRYYEPKNLIPMPPKTRTFFESNVESSSASLSDVEPIVDSRDTGGDARLLVTTQLNPPVVEAVAPPTSDQPQEPRRDKHRVDYFGNLRTGLIDPPGFGFNSLQGVQFDPFTTQFGPFGPYSPYAGSTERQLSLAPPSSPFGYPSHLRI